MRTFMSYVCLSCPYFDTFKYATCGYIQHMGEIPGQEKLGLYRADGKGNTVKKGYGLGKKGMELSTLAYIILLSALAIILVIIFFVQVAGKLLNTG